MYFVFYFVVWVSSLSDSRQSKFGWNLAGGSIEISDLDADVNRTEQNRTEQNRTEQNRTEQNRTEQRRTEQNGTEHGPFCL